MDQYSNGGVDHFSVVVDNKWCVKNQDNHFAWQARFDHVRSSLLMLKQTHMALALFLKPISEDLCCFSQYHAMFYLILLHN